jgi:hypothetical protein
MSDSLDFSRFVNYAASKRSDPIQGIIGEIGGLGVLKPDCSEAKVMLCIRKVRNPL